VYLGGDSMYKTVQNILLAISCSIVMMVGNVQSEGMEIGLITESIPDSGLIQVHDHIFKVGTILVVTKELERRGDISELQEGKLVHIAIGERKSEYWFADVVTLYLGDIASEMAKDMELEYLPHSVKTDKPPRTKSIDTPVIFENGVWKN